MKQKLHVAFLLSFLFLVQFTTAQNTLRFTPKAPHAKWTAKNPFDQKTIIENKGQFEIPGKLPTKDILYGAHQNGLQYYFTATSIWVSKFVSVKRSEEEIEQIEQKRNEREGKDIDDDSWKYKRVEQFHEMNFEGANSQPTIITGNKVSWHYSYRLNGKVNVQANAWKKITYQNLYPGIDMEFYFPDNKSPAATDSITGRSFEYSFTVHPGADISQIRIKYNGNVNLNSDGSLTISSPFGSFNSYVPASNLMSSNKAINCGFSINNGVVKFNADNYDKTETLLIDPLVITPPTFAGTNDVYDVDQDNKGNIYAYGGDYPWEILKYNDKGTLLWSYSTAIRNNEFLGDFAVDRSSQSVYVTEGVDEAGAEIIKLNQAGSVTTTYTGNSNFNEMWKIAFSTCSNQAVVAGGGNTTPSYTASYIDTNLQNLNLVNTLNDQVSGYHDIWSLAIDDFGNAYIITAHSHSTYKSERDSFDNYLLKLPLPNLTPTTWEVHSHYNYLEIASMTYGLNEFFDQPSNGYNGMAISDTTLYTYDGYVIKKWGTHAGKLLDSIFVSGKVNVFSADSNINWGGISVDDCGNVFIGVRDTVKQFDNNLNLVNSFVEPGTIYDVKLSLSDTLYISGTGFITDTAISLPPCHIIQAINKIQNVTCDSAGSATITSLYGGTAPYTIVWNTTPAQTGYSIVNLKKGTYIATITDSSCPRQIYADTVKILGPIKIQLSSNNDTLCQAVPVTISVNGGSNYTWSPAAGLNQTTGSSVIATPSISTTYTVIGTVSVGGCLDTEKVAINIHPLPQLSIKPAQPSICIGQSITLTASGAAAYLWNPSTGLNNDAIASVSATPTTTTTYTLYGTTTFGCIDSLNTVLTVNPIPVVNVTPSNPVICVGKSMVLDASGANTYQWSPTSGLSATNGSDIVATPTINTTYTTIGTSLGCSDTITVPVRVIQDSLKVTQTTTAVCQGNPAVITASGAYNYAWSPSTGLNQTSGSSVTATPTTTTTYTLVGTGLNDCNDTLKVIIKVNLPPAMTITPPTPQICIGKTTPLTVSGAATYTWSPSTALSNTSGSSIIANPRITTTYTAYGTDSLGCNDSAKVVVVVNPLPVITITPSPATICVGNSVTLNASGASTYQWNPSSGLSNTDSSKVTATPSITSTYTIYGTDLNGCIDTTTVDIRVIQDSLKTNTTNTAICQGNSVTISATGANNYQWTPAIGLNTTAGDTVIANPTLTTTYTLSATGANGCPDTQLVVVNVNLPPVLTISPSSPQICIYKTVTLDVNGASTYTWSPSTGLNQTSGSSVTAGPTIATTYTAYGTDVHGCNDSSKVSIKVNPLPIVTATISMDTICHGLSVTLTAKGAVTYQWTPSYGLNTTSDSIVTAGPTITTTYSVYGTDSLGCTDTANVTVNIILNSIKILIDPINSIVCLGNNAKLSATGGINYSWSPSSGLNQTSGDSVTAIPTVTTTYTVIGVGVGDCADTTRATIAVSPPPVIAVQPGLPVICDGQSVILTATGGTIYSWSPSSALSPTTGSMVTANPNVTTSYTIYGTDSLGCNDSTKFTLTVDSNPVAAFAFSIPSICYPQNLQFSNSSSGGATYLWNFGDGSTSSDQNPTHEYAKPGIYKITLIVTSSNGCADTLTESDSSSDYVAGVFVPSSFTPQVPGVNQIFRPNVMCSAPANYLFRVYDRWGEMVYETSDPSDGWNGYFNGKLQPLDVYVYYVELTCGTCSFFKKGDVTLLK